MELVLGGPGLSHVIQHNFGVNEISSMVAIGKAIGSVVTRSTESSIFATLATKYDIYVTSVPQWLRSVRLERAGSILGERQRKVNVVNTMEGVEISSLAGVATFLVLILRFVQPPDDIIGDIEDMLRGTYGMVNGGTLKPGQAPTISGELHHQELPFSLRGLLRNFINSVIDADAQSPQRGQCMQYMAELTGISGSASLARRSTRYARSEHQKVLSFLLQAPRSKLDPGNQFLNTLSAGAAMIGLAAAANGADVVVECMTESGIVQINNSSSSADSSPRSSRTIRLWLKQPPTTIIEELNASDMAYDPESDVTAHPSISVYGGELELSVYIAQQLDCSLTEEETLALWQSGIEAGQSATWNCRRGFDTEVNVSYTDDFLDCGVPLDLARLADGHFNLPRGDRRSKLARKAASLIHECLKANDYQSSNNSHLHTIIKFVMVAIFVGNIKTLISNGVSSLRMYAWTADADVLLGLIQRFADNGTGLSSFQILQQAARIWGGLAPRYLEVPRANDSGSSVNSAVGIICPQLIFLSNILLDPTSVAQRGIDGGLLSCYEGSSPMLPRDPNSGFIFAASPPYTRPPIALNMGSSNPLSLFQSSDVDSNPNLQRLIFSIEPSITSQGTLGLALCIWQSGDMLMMLDPSITQRNLLASRNIERAMQKQSKQRVPSYLGAFVAHLGKDVLRWLECGLTVHAGSCIIDAGPEFEWLVIAAGICAQALVLCLTSDEDIKIVLDSKVLFEDGTTIIIHTSDRAGYSKKEVEKREQVNEAFGWYDIGQTKGPPRIYFGGVELRNT